MNVDKICNAFGAMAEVTLVMYRGAINAGATQDEAKDIVEAYFSAAINHGDVKNREADEGKNNGGERHE